MDRISIFNYEAYYLDYLEGNLSEEDSAMLLSFLKEYPELVLDDHDLPSIPFDETSLPENLKKDLKYISDDEVVDDRTVEYFIIAEAEKLLSKDKSQELDSYIFGKAILEKERKLYQTVRFQPDLSLHFTNKESLKKKSFVLWPYIAGVAAAGIITLLMLYSSNNSTDIKSNQPFYAKKSDRIPLNNMPLEIDKKVNVTTVFPEKLKQDDLTATFLESHEDLTAINQTHSASKDSKGFVSSLKHKSANLLPTKFGNDPLEPVAAQTYNNPQKTMSPPTPDYAFSGFNEMKNPIQPITALISNKIKTDVDFRTAKASTHNAGGFYIKIGKVEISRKKH